MIGALRHKIDLLAATSTPDGGGGFSTDWTPVDAMWAEVERLTSTRNLLGDRTQRLRRLAVSIRYRSDVALGARIRHDGADYDVVSIEDDGDRRRLTLICEEAPR